MQATKSRRASESSHRISAAGSQQARRISSCRSQKENEQQSLCRNPIFELKKGRPNQHTRLESQLKELQEELKRTKDQLASSESCRKSAQQEAEEIKMKLSVMYSKFEDSQRQLIEISATEDDRIHELRKISQERDKAWQSELAALQNQQSIGMAAWCSATKEIQKLKSRIEILKEGLIEKDSVIESLKIEIAKSQDGNVLANKLTNGSSQAELEVESELKKAKFEIAELKSKLADMDVDLRTVLDMNEKLNAEIRAPVSQEDVEFSSEIIPLAVDDSELDYECSRTESELKEAKTEIIDLKLKLVNTEIELRTVLGMNKKLNDETRSTTNQEDGEFSSTTIQSDIDALDLTFESTQIESDLVEAKSEIADLKSKLMHMDAELKTVLDMNNKLNDEIRAHSSQQDVEFSSNTIKSAVDTLELTFEYSQLESELKEAKSEIADLKSKLVNMDTELRTVLDMNNKLNDEIRAHSTQQDVEFSSNTVKSVVDTSELTFESSQLESKLKEAKSEIADLKSKLVDMDADLRTLLDMNTKLNDEIRAHVCQRDVEFSSNTINSADDTLELTFKSSQLESELKEAKYEIANLKSKLVNKDTDLRAVIDMNKKLNNEIRAQVNQVEAEFSSKITQAAVDISELKGKITDKDAALKPMEAELRRVKVHSNQWRKAAEMAAAILMEGTQGRVIESTGSADSGYLCDQRTSMNSPSLDERGEESPGTKNHNVLRMIAGLWKKM